MNQHERRVSLRPLRVDDAAAMVNVLADPSLYEFIGGEPPSRAELERRYAVQCRGHSADGSQEWLNFIVVIPHDQPAGYVQATIPVDGGPAEIAWVIGAAWQGQGLASEAARLLLEYVRRRGVTEIVAHIHPDHVASQHISQNLGMHRTGVSVDGEDEWVGSVPAP